MKRLGVIFVWMVLVLGFLALPLLVLAQASTLSAQLDWSNPVDVTDSVQVEKSSTLAGTYSVLKQLPANSITYTDATNAPGSTACFRVAYFNTSGIGAYAGPVCKTFPATPTQTPSSFTVK